MILTSLLITRNGEDNAVCTTLLCRFIGCFFRTVENRCSWNETARHWNAPLLLHIQRLIKRDKVCSALSVVIFLLLLLCVCCSGKLLPVLELVSMFYKFERTCTNMTGSLPWQRIAIQSASHTSSISVHGMSTMWGSLCVPAARETSALIFALGAGFALMGVSCNAKIAAYWATWRSCMLIAKRKKKQRKCSKDERSMKR